MTAPALVAIFLRGVNVGGVKVTAGPLRECLEGIEGVEAAKTVLASGNAVVRTTLTVRSLRAAVEKALRAEFDYDAWVVVLTLAEVSDLAERCPYALDDRSTHAYLTLTSDPAALDAWEQLADDVGQEYVRLSPVAFAWTCPAGQTLSVPFTTAQAKKPWKEHGAAVTTRNGRTLVRVLAAAEKL